MDTLTPETLAALLEPFPGEMIEWKPQATTKDKKRALAAAYVDPRRYQERLDTVVPGQWQTRVEFGGAHGAVVKIALTICGVTRENVGEADPNEANTVTTAFAQGFKRCCADFGLGRYLYFLPQKWCEYDDQKKQIAAPPPLPAWALPKDRKNGHAEMKSRTNGKTNGKVNGTANGTGHLNGSAEVEQPSVGVAETTPEQPSAPGDYVIPWGKNQGQRLDELEPRWVEWYAHEMKPTTPERQETQEKALAYLESLVQPA